MYNHEPKDYDCPFCKIAKGLDGKYTKESDVVYRDNSFTVFLASHTLPKTNGYLLIVPNRHIENIYDMPDKLVSRSFVLSKKFSIVLKKVFKCGGINIRQHNEPGFGQDVFHYHLHVIPRYKGDNIYNYIENGKRKFLSEKVRKKYATAIKNYLKKHPINI